MVATAGSRCDRSCRFCGNHEHCPASQLANGDRLGTRHRAAERPGGAECVVASAVPAGEVREVPGQGRGSVSTVVRARAAQVNMHPGCQVPQGRIRLLLGVQHRLGQSHHAATRTSVEPRGPGRSPTIPQHLLPRWVFDKWQPELRVLPVRSPAPFQGGIEYRVCHRTGRPAPRYFFCFVVGLWIQRPGAALSRPARVRRSMPRGRASRGPGRLECRPLRQAGCHNTSNGIAPPPINQCGTSLRRRRQGRCAHSSPATMQPRCGCPFRDPIRRFHRGPGYARRQIGRRHRCHRRT